MKAHKIVIFIFTIIVLLAVIASIFPKEGITIGNIHLEFPAIGDVIGTTKELPKSEGEQLSPEQLLENRREAIKVSKENEYIEYFNTNPARFYFPQCDSVSYFDRLFAALEGADTTHMRILHYGDSQLECDRITSELRKRFQEQFGGSGVGLVPAVQTIATYTLSQSATEGIPRYLVYGSSTMRASHNGYGIMGQFAHVQGSGYFSFTGIGKNFPTSKSFNRVSVLACGSGSISLNAGDSTYHVTDSLQADGCGVYRVTLPTMVNKASLSVSGNADIMGIMLDGVAGVSMDNIPMRGCSGTIFTKINRNTLAPFFAKENVKLIILQYGGNSVPYLKSAKSIENYKNSIKKQIALFKQLEPNACILFIGPADMATNNNGSMETYPYLEDVINALKEAANEEGVAFWDMCEAMGGRNSIVKWVKSSPQLAGSDYIHFTPKGAQEIADMLYDTFQLYYKYYRLRTGKDDATTTEIQSGTADETPSTISPNDTTNI